jgi:broad specificity phosphatase PhoE
MRIGVLAPARLVPAAALGAMAFLAAVVVPGAGPALADPPVGHETIVFVRHGEKPLLGLGQLDCQGLNRALALPAVLSAKYAKPAAIFAPDPSKRKDDDGGSYDYIRPLATIEPTAIRLGMPVDTTFGFDELAPLRDALERPAYHDATVVVAWEHRMIETLAKMILSAHGGAAAGVPTWKGEDYDSIYVVTLDWAAKGVTATFKRDAEGLDARSKSCPS